MPTRRRRHRSQVPLAYDRRCSRLEACQPSGQFLGTSGRARIVLQENPAFCPWWGGELASSNLLARSCKDCRVLSKTMKKPHQLVFKNTRRATFHRMVPAGATLFRRLGTVRNRKPRRACVVVTRTFLRPLFAFPGAAVLVMHVSRFDEYKAFGTNKDPRTVFVCTNAIEHVLGLLAAIALFRTNSFDLDHRRALASLSFGSEAAGFITGFGLTEFGLVFGHPAPGTLSPPFERTILDLSTHQLDDVTR